MVKDIMFYSGNLFGGGAERVITILASTLAELGYNVTLLVNRVTESDYYVSKKVKIVVVDSKKQKYPSASLYHKFKRHVTAVKFIRNYIKQNKPQVIIPFLNTQIFRTFFATRFLKVKFVPSLRCTPRTKKFNVYNLIRSFIFYNSDAIYFQTEAQRQLFCKHTQKKGFVLSNPISLDFINNNYKTYSNKITNVVSVSRITAQKNHKMLIDAIINLHPTYENVNLKIYGDGDLVNELNEYINKNNAESYIKLMGKVKDVASVLKSSDLFVLSSNVEGMPNALMEAMAIGLPCISTDCKTGPKELIGNNERGVLVKVGSTSDLTDAIANLIEDNDFAIKLGTLAKEYIVSEFTPENISRKLINNIETLIK